jgi:hypothetical protein
MKMAAVCSLASPPFLRSDGFVQIDVSIDGTVVTALVHRSRGAGAPAAPSPEFEQQAMQFCHDYALSHALLFHGLFAPTMPSGSVSSVSFSPGKGMLTFKLALNGVDCEMDVDCSLELGNFRSVPGWHDTDEGMEQFGIAFDLCITYIVGHLDEIRRFGFDTSELERQQTALAAGVW